MMLERRAFCFYEYRNKRGRKEIQAKWFDRESGVTYYLKPVPAPNGRAVAADEMWFCEIGETTFSQLDEEGCRTVSEIVRVLPTQYLGVKRGEVFTLSLSRSPACRGSEWEASRCVRQLGPGNQLVGIQPVIDRNSDQSVFGYGPYRCRVTKLVSCIVPGRHTAADVIVAVEIISPVMANSGNGKSNGKLTKVVAA